MRAPADRSDTIARDAELVARLQQGDASAIGDVAHVHGPALLRFAARIVGADDLADDVLQRVLWRLWQERDAVHSDKPLAPLLFRLTRNDAIDLMRSRRASDARDARWARERAVDAPFTTNTGERSSEADDVRADILRALDDVPERSREIFLLAWDEQLSSSAIAEMLGLSMGTVHNQMSRAVRRLAQWLEERRSND